MIKVIRKNERRKRRVELNPMIIKFLLKTIFRISFARILKSRKRLTRDRCSKMEDLLIRRSERNLKLFN